MSIIVALSLGIAVALCAAVFAYATWPEAA
jgi:hypothetical protein